jgi:hypothetical protein
MVGAAYMSRGNRLLDWVNDVRSLHEACEAIRDRTLRLQEQEWGRFSPPVARAPFRQRFGQRARLAEEHRTHEKACDAA